MSVSRAPGGSYIYRCASFVDHQTHNVACWKCGSIATKLCDHPSGKGTCDATLCARCAKRQQDGRDFCPSH